MGMLSEALDRFRSGTGRTVSQAPVYPVVFVPRDQPVEVTVRPPLRFLEKAREILGGFR